MNLTCIVYIGFEVAFVSSKLVFTALLLLLSSLLLDISEYLGVAQGSFNDFVCVFHLHFGEGDFTYLIDLLLESFRLVEVEKLVMEGHGSFEIVDKCYQAFGWACFLLVLVILVGRESMGECEDSLLHLQLLEDCVRNSDPYAAKHIFLRHHPHFAYFICSPALFLKSQGLDFDSQALETISHPVLD
jgi:hypothetical protein